MSTSVQLPSLFLERLKEIVPSAQLDSVLRSFSSARPISIRVNKLKDDRNQICQTFKERNIEFRLLPWCDDALILENISKEQLWEMDLIKEGKIYQQASSSMLVPVVLNPQPGERVLDLCAAPGSKTSQIAAMMNNEGEIIAVEHIKDRYYRLKSVLSLLGVTNTKLKMMDGRRYKDSELFDRILVDAPCSSEGRFHLADKKSFGFWSLRKIKEMVQKQRGLLLSASRLLKPNGILVYSTCTFAPEENEGVVDWFLRKTKERFTIYPVELNGIETYPAIKQWKGKVYRDVVSSCVRLLPTQIMDGFFIAKLRKEE